KLTHYDAFHIHFGDWMSEEQRSTEAAQLETIDRRIISALADDGRISVTALAEKVHISRAHCYSRLQYLQKHGVITGYSISVDHARLGFGASAQVILNCANTIGEPCGRNF